MRVGASLVRGELDYWATTLARFIDDPPEHRGSQTPTSMARGDPHGLDLGSKVESTDVVCEGVTT